MSDEQHPIPEFLRPHLTQEQYDRAREYLKTPHTRVDLSPGEWDDLINGRGWPKDCWTLPDLAPEGAELESWLGTKKYAPEDNLASKTWTKLEQLTNRLERLEART